jgi:peptide methionine sulfoxide reductase msrA/msrB
MIKILFIVILAVVVGLMIFIQNKPAISADTKGKGMEKAIFGLGCFWGAEADFQNLNGVVATRVGYSGGTKVNPDYEMVCGGKTGHTEVVEITFDPKVITYYDLLNTFWGSHDPTVRYKPQYISVVFYLNDAQKADAEKMKAELIKLKKFVNPIVTEILPAKEFYVAEGYHQKYNEKHGVSCKANACAIPSGVKSEDVKLKDEIKVFSVEKNTDITVKAVKKTDDEWLKQLGKLSYEVTRKQGTEPPFDNAYWDNHKKGVYKCIGCGTDLFTTEAKFDSGTGWPSFTKPVASENVMTINDKTHNMTRTEVRCPVCGAHLGHVFDDGPKPTGKRYCINSASLEFIEKK